MTTPSQSRDCYKSVLSRPSHTFKLETVTNHFFQDHHTLPNQKLLQISSFKTTTPFPKWKLLQISSFKTTTPSKSRNCYKSILSRPPHPHKEESVTNQFFLDHYNLPKQNLLQISSFKTTTTFQSRNCYKSVLSR